VSKAQVAAKGRRCLAFPIVYNTRYRRTLMCDSLAPEVRRTAQTSESGRMRRRREEKTFSQVDDDDERESDMMKRLFNDS